MTRGRKTLRRTAVNKDNEPAEAPARSPACCQGAQTYQTNVENEKQPRSSNHVGLSKDYNTIYLEKHNVTHG